MKIWPGDRRERNIFVLRLELIWKRSWTSETSEHQCRTATKRPSPVFALRRCLRFPKKIFNLFSFNIEIKFIILVWDQHRAGAHDVLSITVIIRQIIHSPISTELINNNTTNILKITHGYKRKDVLVFENRPKTYNNIGGSLYDPIC